jgi:hypothetical protein
VTTTERTAAPSRPAEVPAPWLDRLIGSDPGLNRLRMALEAVLAIGLAIAAEGVFVHLTHALQARPHGTLPPAEQAAVDAGNHALLVIAIMLGAIVALLSVFGASMEPDPRRQLLLTAAIPIPMIAALALGISLSAHRVLSLTVLVLVLAGGTYCRRFGPAGFLAGQLLFMGDFFGFFLHGVLTIDALGWLAAEIVLGSLIAVAAHRLLFRPDNRRALGRLRRSYTSRARAVLALTLELMEHPSDAAARRLERQLARLNETALMIDAQLTLPASVPADASARTVHQRLFDLELALSNACRLATTLARSSLPPALRSSITSMLVALGERRLDDAAAQAHEMLAELRGARGEIERTTAIVAHRYGVSVLGLVAAVQAWQQAPADGPDREPFRSSAILFGGFLPGSAMVSATASTEAGPGRMDRILLAPYVRVAIQMGVAVGAAVILGDLLSGRRFYWAVIAAFVTFMGTNHTGEQVRKALFRVIGTFLGIMVGALLAHAVGPHTAWSVVVILVSLFLGLYLMRINYAFMVVGITVMVSQLYVQLGEFTDSLLVLRLEETALGAAVTILVVLLVLPLRGARVLRVAQREQVAALADVVDQGRRRLLDDAAELDLRTAVRTLDTKQQALLATAVPVGGFGPSADSPEARFLSAASAARYYARNLVVDFVGADPVPGYAHEDVELAAGTLLRSLGQIQAALGAGPSTPSGPAAPLREYLRSAVLFDEVATSLDERDYLAPIQLALRDLQLIDGAMAQAAKAVGLPVRGLDT